MRCQALCKEAARSRCFLGFCFFAYRNFNAAIRYRLNHVEVINIMTKIRYESIMHQVGFIYRIACLYRYGKVLLRTKNFAVVGNCVASCMLSNNNVH